MARWDSGRAQLAVRLTPLLVARWLRTGDAAALDAALEPLLPPQSLLLGINLAALGTSRVAGTRTLVCVAVGSIAAQVAYVGGGLAVLRASPAVWRAFLTVPGFVVRRLAGMSRSMAGRGPAGWERTQREDAPQDRAACAPGAAEIRVAPSVS
jgi:hypothetical protein